MTALDSYYISVYGPTGLNILKHFYPLSESVGATTAVDSIGGQNGTNSLIVAGTTGILPTSDGSTAYTFVASSFVNLTTPFPLGTGSKFSVELWFKFTTLANFQGLYQNGVNTHGNNMWLNSTSLDLSSDNTSTETGGITFATGTVYHCVGLYEGTNRKIYINGVQRATGAATPGSTPTTSNYIGRWTALDGPSFQGVMQKFLYYNDALTPTQITNNYNAGLTGPPATGGVIAPPMGGNLGAFLSAGFQGG